MKNIIISLLVLLIVSGCSKKEFKGNWNNIKKGVKKDWKSAKKTVADTTEEYKEH